MSKYRKTTTEKTLLNRFGWLIVVGACLSVSTWSLFWIARNYGAPAPIAAMVSAVYDGAALLSADYALRYARSADSGFGPRMAVFIFAGISGFLNSQHAVLAHDPPAARIFYASPPIIAVAIFEFHSRYTRRRALRNAGRLPAALPPFGRFAWLLEPLRTMGILRRIVHHRLTMIELRETGGTGSGTSEQFPGVSGEFGESSVYTMAELIQYAETRGITLSHAMLREWAKQRGMIVSDRGPLPREIVSAFHAELTAGDEPEPELPGIVTRLEREA